MRLRRRGIEAYAERLFDKLWHSGVDFEHFPGSPTIDPTGTVRLAFEGWLPDSGLLQKSHLAIHESWTSAPQGYWERAGYTYELIDHVNDFRRAFHWHDPEYFIRRFQVVVHQHCEEPIGRVRCRHYESPPVTDAFRGIEVLLGIWQIGTGGCGALTCLE